MSNNHDLQRFESAQRSRDALRIENQPKPSNVVRITRYRDGRVVEIIERTVEQQRTVERTLFRQSATKGKAALLAEYNALPVTVGPAEFLRGRGNWGLTEGEHATALRLATAIEKGAA